jgi:hypothetical protein
VSIIEYTKNDGNLTGGWESICTLQDMVLGLFIEDFFNFLIFDDHRQLKKCHDCSVFYIATKNNPRQKYCPDCSKKNHTPKQVQAERTRRTRAKSNKRKEKKGKEKREALYERQYKRLIEAGHKEEEARQEAEDYVIEQMPVIE